MSSELSIRPVARRDYEQWLPLWDGYNAFYGRSGATALDPEVTRMTWQRFFDAYEPVHGLVAQSGGQLLGLTHYLFHRSTTAIQPSCYLQDLLTSAAARGKGVGRALIHGVYRQAKLAGSPRVYWQTHETNLTAMQLYEWQTVPDLSSTARCSDGRPCGVPAPRPGLGSIHAAGTVDKFHCHGLVTKRD